MTARSQRLAEVTVIDPRLDEYLAIMPRVLLDNGRINHFVSGEDALRNARPRSSALWLVSIGLPDMSSLDLLTILRRRVRRATVFLVGDVYSPADEFAARLAGATAYVCKPPTAAWLEYCRPRCRSPAIRAGPVVTTHGRFT